MELFKSDKSGDTKGGIGGLLSSKKEQPIAARPDYSRDFNTMSRKLRISEERTIALRKKIQVIEHNMLLQQKKVLTEIKFINQELSDIRRDFDDIKSKLLIFSRELQEMVKKEDVAVLEKYINLWEPVNFVTRAELERALQKLRQ